MLTITPQELISAARIAANAVREELRDVAYDISYEKVLRGLNRDDTLYLKNSYKDIQKLKRRKAKLEKTLLILKHMYM